MEGATPLMWGQLVSIGLMAVALGLDALSLGLGLGMKGIRKLDVLKISSITALFHVVMPLLGMWMGGYLSVLLGQVASMGGGLLLLLLGAHMVYSSLQAGESKAVDYRSFWGMLVFSLSVSIDSFSVGVSLGMFSGDVLMTVGMFGAAGGLMSMAGLMLGRRVGTLFGEYGEALGGVILLAFGLKFLL